jgi:hypothetical protein
MVEKHDKELGSHIILDIGYSEGAFHDYLNRHQRRYSRNAFMKLISESGLKTEQWSYYKFFLFPFFILVTLLSKLICRSEKKPTVLKPLPKPFNYMLKQMMYLETWMISRLGIRLPFISSLILC